MSVLLKPMNEKELNEYLGHSLKKFALEQVKAGNWKEEEAEQNARAQFEQLFPEGLSTKEHILFSVHHEGEPIGILWVYIQDKNQEKQAYIYDIELDEDQRGKGLGKATMLALEEYAKSENIKQIRLHVFAHNQRAIALYKKVGYEMTNHQMLKRLP